MQNKIFRLAFVLLALLSCEKEIVYETTTKSFQTADFDVCNDQPCPEINITAIQINQPAVVSSQANHWIKENIIALIQGDHQDPPSSIEAALYTYINDSQIAYPESVALSTQHEITIGSSISFSSNDLLSIYLNKYQFSGGASGFRTTTYLNINPKTGKRFDVLQLVSEDFYAFAKAYYIQQNNTILDTDLNETELVEIGFTDVGIITIYKTVDVGFINSEEYEILTPWDIAKDYFKL